MAGTDSLQTNCMTMNRFILEDQKFHPHATGDLTHLLSSILTAVKAISTAVRRAGMTNMFGVAGHENVQGEQLSCSKSTIKPLKTDTFGGMCSSYHKSKKAFGLIEEFVSVEFIISHILWTAAFYLRISVIFKLLLDRGHSKLTSH